MSIGGIFICLLFQVKDVKFIDICFFREFMYMPMVYYEESGRVG